MGELSDYIFFQSKKQLEGIIIIIIFESCSINNSLLHENVEWVHSF